jgi:hypothetical protein
MPRLLVDKSTIRKAKVTCFYSLFAQICSPQLECHLRFVQKEFLWDFCNAPTIFFARPSAVQFS